VVHHVRIRSTYPRPDTGSIVALRPGHRHSRGHIERSSGAASVSERERERDEEANDVRSDSDNSVPSGLMMSKRSLDDEEDNDDADAVSWTTRDLPVDASIVLLMAQEMARAQRTDPDPDLAEEGFPEEIRGVDDVSNGLAEMIIQHLQELGISDSAQPPRRQRGEVVEFGEMITE
jgi:hypothetical protein